MKNYLPSDSVMVNFPFPLEVDKIWNKGGVTIYTLKHTLEPGIFLYVDCTFDQLSPMEEPDERD